MLTLRKAQERGNTKLNWLNSWHSFSFDSYYDPTHNNFGPLRVINEDIIAAGGGFGTHAHSDMEILTYVLQGSLEHKDSLGNGSLIVPGELQRMTAGTGIRHSEYNHSKDVPLHLLQIWIIPAVRGLTPSYEQKSFAIKQGNGWQLIASPQGKDDSLLIHQDVCLSVAKLEAREKLIYNIASGREVWLQVAEGELQVDNQKMLAGDGASVSDVNSLELIAGSSAHVLLFDIAQTK